MSNPVFQTLLFLSVFSVSGALVSCRVHETHAGHMKDRGIRGLSCSDSVCCFTEYANMLGCIGTHATANDGDGCKRPYFKWFDHSISSVVTGNHDVCVLLSNGDVHCSSVQEHPNKKRVGTRAWYRRDLKAPAARITAGMLGVCALLLDKTIDCWGMEPVQVFQDGAVIDVSDIEIKGCALIGNIDSRWYLVGATEDCHVSPQVWENVFSDAYIFPALGQFFCASHDDAIVSCWRPNAYFRQPLWWESGPDIRFACDGICSSVYAGDRNYCYFDSTRSWICEGVVDDLARKLDALGASTVSMMPTGSDLCAIDHSGRLWCSGQMWACGFGDRDDLAFVNTAPP
jgi:hypothetical protein